jgi:hypothetical protein
MSKSFSAPIYNSPSSALFARQKCNRFQNTKPTATKMQIQIVALAVLFATPVVWGKHFAVKAVSIPYRLLRF